MIATYALGNIWSSSRRNSPSSWNKTKTPSKMNTPRSLTVRRIYTCPHEAIIGDLILYVQHRVKRLITSEGAKRRIWDDITVILKYCWQMTTGWYMYIKFVHKNSFRKPLGSLLSEEIWTVKFCTEVFVMPKHLMTKLNPFTITWTILIHVYPRCDCFT